MPPSTKELPMQTVQVTVPAPVPEGLEETLWEDLEVVATVSTAGRGLPDVPGYAVLAGAMAPFLTAMVTKWGEDSADALRRVLGGIRGRADRSDPAELRLLDEDSGVSAVVGDDVLADKRAVTELRDVRWAAYREGTVLRWDGDRRQWRP
jgi:hypothetical protein